MSTVAFLYTPRRFCMSWLGQWLVFPDGIVLRKIKFLSDPSEVELRNRFLLISLISLFLINRDPLTPLVLQMKFLLSFSIISVAG